MVKIKVDTLEQTEQLAQKLAQGVGEGAQKLTVHLIGDLGAGKTSFARAFIQALGYSDAVRSPTYNIVQSYTINQPESEQLTIYHFDLYRLSDPEELEALGIRDYFTDNTICLIEWPEKGKGVLPEPDLILTITLQQQNRDFVLTPVSEHGHKTLSNLDEFLHK